jgi:hypothetical protein
MTETTFSQLNWPEEPYKGFSYYGPNDRALYAGREHEILQFTRLIGSPDARVMLLHGATGCGKSSFLRAGVIPFLEGGLRGFEFLKLSQTNPQEKFCGDLTRSTKSVFIRATDDPYGKLSEAVFQFASASYSFESPFGLEIIDLSSALNLCRTADDFVRHVARSPALLVEALEYIASSLPKKLVLIIDQAEEVLTLGDAGPEAERAKNTFFEFIRMFSERQLTIRLVLALRTEYYGVFQTRIRRGARQYVQFQDFFLEDLSESDLHRVIVRPTQQSPVEGVGVPREFYRFQFEDSLPSRITGDLRNIVEAGGLIGGALPVLQVVCETLYRATRSRGADGKQWTITLKDYEALGPLQMQLGDYVDRVIGNGLRIFEKSETAAESQIFLWKDLLTLLAKTKVDSTVTTDLVKIDDLRSEAKKFGAEHFDDMLRYLADDNQSVLRREYIRKIGTRDAIEVFSLRHDAIGLVLDRWRSARSSMKHTAAAFRKTYLGFMSAGLVMYAGFGFYSLWSFIQNPKELLQLAISVGAFAFVAMGLWTQFRAKMWRNDLPLYRILQYADVSGGSEDPVFRLLARHRTGNISRSWLLRPVITVLKMFLPRVSNRSEANKA